MRRGGEGCSLCFAVRTRSWLEVGCRVAHCLGGFVFCELFCYNLAFFGWGSSSSIRPCCFSGPQAVLGSTMASACSAVSQGR